MARISYQPQQQLQNLPGVRVSDAPAEAIARAGQSFSQAAGAFAGVAGQIAQKEQEKANVAAQMEIENQLSGLENETLHSPETGLLNTQGKDAIGAGKAFSETWGTRESKIVAGAPRQIQEWAKQRAADRRMDGERMLMRHSVQEGDKYYTGQASGVVANAVHSGTLNYLDPDRVEKEAARAMIAAEQLANLTGADETSRKMMVITAASKVNSAVLDRMIATDPDAALTRLDRVRDQMTGDDLARIESVLRPVLIDSGYDAWMQGQVTGQPSRASESPVEGAAQTLTEVDAVARASVARTVGLESGGVATAKNPRSSATGAGQFLESTWMSTVQQARPELMTGKTRAQVLELRNDPAIAREMTEAFAVSNARGLHDSGIPVTEQTVYMAHHFGISGARKIMRASPDTPIESLLTGKEVSANPYLKGKTVAQVISNHEGRAGEPPAATNNSRSPPAAIDGKPDWVELERRAQGIPNPTVRDRYVQRLRADASLQNRQEAEADKQLSEQTIAAINGNPNAPLRSVLSPDVYAKNAREGKLPQLESYRENMAMGGMVQDDFPTVERLGRMAELDPQAFMRENIAGQSEKLSTASLGRFMDMQRKGAKAAKGGKVEDWASDAQRLGRIFRRVGVNDESDAAGEGSGVKNAPRERHRGELRVMWMDAVERYTASNGKRPEREDADRIADEVARNYADKKSSVRPDVYGDKSTRMERNTQRMDDKRPTISESVAGYRRELSPADDARQQNRAIITGRYRAKYSTEPSAQYINDKMAEWEKSRE